MKYFNDFRIDAWAVKKGFNELCSYDHVPEPKVVEAMLHAARRVNDVRLAIRILKAIKSKAAGDKEIYNSVLSEIKPTVDELGLGNILRRS